MEESIFPTGMCMEMCPQSEIEMRTEQCLLHRLETEPGLKPVKEYNRSAAGKSDEPIMNIRPPEVLQATVTYLFNTVLSKGTTLEVHNFVANRLRAIQQDLFKQQCPADIALPILEPIVRYYAWAAYWFSEESAFDKHNHDILLLDSLKDCLRLSDDHNISSSIDIEALYILFSLGAQQPLNRTTLKSNEKKYPLIFLCFKMSILWHLGNFVAVSQMIKKLPVLLAALTSVKHLEFIRRHGLNVMSTSYSCRHNITPLGSLVTAHMFSSEEEAKEACLYYGIPVENGGIIFNKPSFNKNATVKPFKRQLWIQEKLAQSCLPEIFFNGSTAIG